MARINLTLLHLGSARGIRYFRPEDRSGTVYHIPRPWLTVRLFVPPRDTLDGDEPHELPPNRKPLAILDTGAPLSVFPFPVWQPFRDDIVWLNQPPAGPRGHRLTILGGTFPYRLGRLRFGAIDEDGNWLPAVMSNVWFLEDDSSAPRQAVLGLRTRLFEQRQLRCADLPDDAFGQAWALEDS